MVVLMIAVTAKQVQKNREGINAMWKKIPAKWVMLDTFLSSQQRKKTGAQYSKTELAKKCDGKGGPSNSCGAVGCFAGWNWTYHPYQAWCRRNQLAIVSTTNLSIYLGLQAQTHEYFIGREYEHKGMSEKKEVAGRLKKLMKEPIFGYQQSADVA